MFFRCVLSRVLGLLFAAALVNSICLSDGAFAQVGTQMNSLNTGHNISAGTYFNTPGSHTTFQNTAGGGLWLHSGDLVRGLEATAGKVPTGNGGTLLFNAPCNAVRIDGNIDVSAIRNGTLYTGNGGHIILDANHIYQAGFIIAGSSSSPQGSVTSPILGSHSNMHVNVSSLLLGPAGVHAGQVHAGMAQLGNNVNPIANGMPSIASVVDMNGKVIGKYDPSLIAIKGGLINLDGISIANGVKKQNVAGTGTVALLAHEQPNGAGAEAVSGSTLAEDLRSNLVAGKMPVKLGDRQWLSLETGTAGKAP